MKQVGFSIYQLSFFVLAATVLTFLLTALPTKASALEVVAQTAQVLPVGGNSCAPVSVANFTPYIYDGALHSFDFTISDPSYVALMGSVGNTSVPFNLMTRRVDASGMLRVHVDIATTPIVGTLPIKVTLLSSRTGSPVCLTVASMSVGSGPVVVQTVPADTTYTYTAPSAAPVTTTAQPAAGPVSAPSVAPEAPALTTSVTPSPVVNTMSNPLRNVCATDVGAYRLWLILLVLYTLIVGAALWAEFPMAASWARTPERIATIILGLLLLLLAFWYFSISCRAALWMPLAAFLIAVLGLLAAFWNHPRVTQLLLIQETKTTSATLITPPPKK